MCSVFPKPLPKMSEASGNQRQSAASQDQFVDLQTSGLRAPSSPLPLVGAEPWVEAGLLCTLGNSHFPGLPSHLQLRRGPWGASAGIRGSQLGQTRLKGGLSTTVDVSSNVLGAVVGASAHQWSALIPQRSLRGDTLTSACYGSPCRSTHWRVMTGFTAQP